MFEKGACDTWNVEINILVYENEMFSLPAEFHLNLFMYEIDNKTMFSREKMYDYHNRSWSMNNDKVT